MHFTGIHTDFLGAKEGACITSAYGKSDSKWPLKSVCIITVITHQDFNLMIFGYHNGTVQLIKSNE